jgi:hypothetical protein
MPDDVFDAPWPDAPKIEEGTYLFPGLVEICTLQGQGGEKPYLLINYKVEKHKMEGIKFTFRVYITPSAERWARYFFKKFGYPAELLEKKHIVCKPKEGVPGCVEGLRGRVIVVVSKNENSGMLDFDVRGFGHYEADEELDKTFERMTAPDEVVTVDQGKDIDVNADIGGEAPVTEEVTEDLFGGPAGSSKVEPEPPATKPGYQATDEDLPPNMWPEEQVASDGLFD